MAGEKQVIYYSTIYLTRREDILVQSIISLYRSKDGFEWLYSDLKDSTVVIVGTAIDSPKLDQAAFDAIQKEQIVCVLGDAFYPKDARALIHIELPIKALIFVDQLSDIERNYINKPLSINYIATNALVKKSLQTRVNNPSINESNIGNAQNVRLNKEGMIDFVSRSTKADKSNNIDSSSNNPEKFDIPSASIKVPNLGVFLKNETVKQDAFSFSLEAGLSSSRYLSQESAESIPTIDDTVTSQESIKPDTVKEVTTLKEPPVLTEAIMDNSSWDALLKAKAEDTQQDQQSILNSQSLTNQEKTKSISSSLTENKKIDNSIKVNEEQKNTRELSSASSPVAGKPRCVKLLRWPKSEIIQRHPGNAILASMVINVPMAVNDMAEQSDLPIQICQRFIDAVIDSNVAEYIDDISNKSDASELENIDQLEKNVEENSQRQGILYRIRSALGLLRK